MWSYLVTKIYIVSYAFCEQFVNRTGNFVKSLIAGVDDGRSAVDLPITINCFYFIFDNHSRSPIFFNPLIVFSWSSLS